MEKRINSDDLTLVVTAIDIARKTGGNLTEIFDSISETIRGRMRIERKVRTLTAQGRLQGLIVSLMPFLLCIVMTVMKPGIMIPFLTSLNGIVCLLVASVMVLVGWLVIRKIVTIKV
jgi:tight adherence protein B